MKMFVQVSCLFARRNKIQWFNSQLHMFMSFRSRHSQFIIAISADISRMAIFMFIIISNITTSRSNTSLNMECSQNRCINCMLPFTSHKENTGIYLKKHSCSLRIYWIYVYELSLFISKWTLPISCRICVAFNTRSAKDGHQYSHFYNRCSGKFAVHSIKFTRYEIPTQPVFKQEQLALS